MNSIRCHRPLTLLGKIHMGWWDILVQQIGTIQVPGYAVSWNCQDYVIEIWDAMHVCEMIDEGMWAESKEKMMDYYGQDFGNQPEPDNEEIEEDEQGVEGPGGPFCPKSLCMTRVKRTHSGFNCS